VLAVSWWVTKTETALTGGCSLALLRSGVLHSPLSACGQPEGLPEATPDATISSKKSSAVCFRRHHLSAVSHSRVTGAWQLEVGAAPCFVRRLPVRVMLWSQTLRIPPACCHHLHQTGWHTRCPACALLRTRVAEMGLHLTTTDVCDSQGRPQTVVKHSLQ
jgi:hypothetical protein